MLILKRLNIIVFCVLFCLNAFLVWTLCIELNLEKRNPQKAGLAAIVEKIHTFFSEVDPYSFIEPMLSSDLKRYYSTLDEEKKTQLLATGSDPPALQPPDVMPEASLPIVSIEKEAEPDAAVPFSPAHETVSVAVDAPKELETEHVVEISLPDPLLPGPELISKEPETQNSVETLLPDPSLPGPELVSKEPETQNSVETLLPDPSLLEPKPVREESEYLSVMDLDPFIAAIDDADAGSQVVEQPLPILIASINPDTNGYPEYYDTNSEPWKLARYPLPKRLTLRHVEGVGEGVSYGTDYSTLAILSSPDYREGYILPMLDLRGHRFDNNLLAANIGLIGRYIPEAEDRFYEVLGFNVYYDWREGFKWDYQQIGVGLEILGKKWDFRANGYVPIGKKTFRTTCVYDDYEDGFYAIHRDCEFTSYGFNAEVGYLAEWCSEQYMLYIAGGPYYLARKCLNNRRGGEIRIRPQYRDYLALDFSLSYDNVFHAVFQAQVIVYLPLYQIKPNACRRNYCGLTERQIYQPVERFEVMPLGRRSCWERNF